MPRAHQRGFTIVEILVVVSIIAILLSLMVSGISGAIRTSKSTKQMSALRQIYLGWTMYANQFNDQCIPGFLSTDVQKNWKVNYHTRGNINGQTSDKLNRAVTQTYPWRLAPYLDYSWDLLLGYREDPNTGDANSLYTIEPLQVQSKLLSSQLQKIAPSSLAGSTVALQPCFGYNAFYLGGWWDLSKSSNMKGIPRPYFVEGLRIATGATTVANTMSRTIGGILLPDHMTVFCPASYFGANTPMPGGMPDPNGTPNTAAGYRTPEASWAGAAWLTPPWLGTERIWSISNDDPSSLAVYTDQALPLMRFSKQIAAVKGDGTTKLQNYSDFDDMREWMNLSNITNVQKRRAMHTGTILDQ
ncbi:MAG: type II secretion system protein [Phycisphaerales bacterium]|nr:type II secretion system protein [Phycisphaerales bacterium]